MEWVDKSFIRKSDKILVLECASTCIDLINHFITLYEGDLKDKIEWILNYNIWCYDINIIDEVEKIYGLPKSFNLYTDDFIISYLNEEFDFIFGYPYIDYNVPFKEKLHNIWGRLNGYKIPIEAWSIVKSIDLLSDNGIIKLGYDINFEGRKYLGLQQLNISKNKQDDFFYYTYKKEF